MRVLILDDVTPAEVAEVKAQLDVVDAVTSEPNAEVKDVLGMLGRLRQIHKKGGQVTPDRTWAAPTWLKPKSRSNGAKAAGNGEAPPADS